MDKVMMQELTVSRFLAAAILLAMSTATAQRTWIVDELNRPGTDHADIQSAYVAAAPGDTIHVRTGDQLWPHYFAPDPHVIDGKGVDIVGEPGNPAWIYGPFTVRNVPATQRMLFAHLENGTERTLVNEHMPPSPTQAFREGFQLAANQGAIVLDHIEMGARCSIFANSGINATDCDLVVISHSTLRSCQFGPWFVRSRGVIESCTLSTEKVGQATGGSGLYVTRDSTVWFMNSHVSGYDAQPIDPTDVGTGVQLCGASHLFVDAASSVAVGRGSGQFSVSSNGPCPIVAAPDSTLHRDPAAQIFGLIDWRLFDVVSPVAALRTAVVRSGSTEQLRVDQIATTNAAVLLAASKLQSVPWVSDVGPIWLDPFLPILVEVGVADSSGRRTANYPIPQLLPRGLTLAMQAFDLQPGGAVRTTNVSHVGSW